MKTFHKFAPAVIAGFAAQFALAHGDAPDYQPKYDPRHRPESHAPAGVMVDHVHKQGEWMFGYRYMEEGFSDVYRGSRKVTAGELADAGYTMMPTAMTMEMHMLDIMYALSDNLTLMLMPQYMTMDMAMASTGATMMNSMHGGHGAGGGHEVSGIGDTVVAGLWRLAGGENHRVHATVGISAPTGSVTEKNADGSYVHYGMQLGTGTWDLVPSLTWLGDRGALSWGAQVSARLPMEHENEAGFAFGERYEATTWGAWRAYDWVSLSLRLAYAKEGDIDGHYNGPHGHSSPPDLQANYGGEFLDYGIGVNLVAQSGPVAGVRLGLEWVGDLSASYNGFQLGREDGLNLSLSYVY